jgi:hypothetical protein
MREIRATNTLGGDMFTVQISAVRSEFREEVLLHFHGCVNGQEAMSSSTGFMPFDDALELLSAIITGRKSIRSTGWHHADIDTLHATVRSMIGGSSFDYATDLEDGIARATQALHQVLTLKASK